MSQKKFKDISHAPRHPKLLVNKNYGGWARKENEKELIIQISREIQRHFIVKQLSHLKQKLSSGHPFMFFLKPKRKSLIISFHRIELHHGKSLSQGIRSYEAIIPKPQINKWLYTRDVVSTRQILRNYAVTPTQGKFQYNTSLCQLPKCTSNPP